MRTLARAALAFAIAAEAIFAAGFVGGPVRAAGTPAAGLLVSVGYAEDKETNDPNPAAFPVPWQGSPNVVFVGGPVVGQTQCGTLPSCFDTGAIRLDNPTGSDISVSDVSVDVHSSIPGGKVFDLWGSFVVPAGQSVILAENPPGDTATFDDFDTSGFPGNNCTPVTVAPTVTITVGGAPTTLADSTHVLDTGGIDVGFCPGANKNESIAWRPIGTVGSVTATLDLAPATATKSVGGSVTETATLLDGAANPLAEVAVDFNVTSGPDAGQTGSGFTDAAGHVGFTYQNTGAGTDIVAASVTTVGSFETQSMVVWGPNTGPIWTGEDIGPPPIPGSDSVLNGVWTISGSGRDIGGTSDQFHYVSQPLGGDGSISARVLTQTNINSRARAGVMLRQSDDPAAPFYAALVTPSTGLWVLERASSGGAVISVVNVPGTVPTYLRVDRTGFDVTASTSTDGTTWTVIPGSSSTLDVNGAVLAGMAVTSHDITALGSATFDSVALSGGLPPPPPNDFSLSASPSTVPLSAGNPGSTSISTAVVSGSAESIVLSVSGAPAGVTADFNPTTVTAGASSTLNLAVGSSVAPGDYPITITGTAPSATHSVPLTLSVTQPVVDHLVLAPASATITTGAGQPYTAEAFDAANHDLGDVTSVTTFAIAGGGSCTAASCTSSVLGDHTVTGTDGAATGTATLHVVGITVPGGSTYHALTPARILDTRNGTGGISGPITSHVARWFAVSGVAGVPAGATAVTGNLTVTGQSANGFLYLGPDQTDNPTSSTLNFPVGDTRANAVTVALSGGGTPGLLWVTYVGRNPGSSAAVIFDVTGFFTPDTSGDTYHALTPARVLDSRDGTGGIAGAITDHVARFFAVAGSGGVPAGATAVTGNLTVTGQSAAGFLYLGPQGATNPTSSTLNFPAGDTRANGVTVALSSGAEPGGLWVTYVAKPSNATTQVIFDVTGYFTADLSGSVFVPLIPTRLLDTRNGTGGIGGPLHSHVPGSFPASGGTTTVPGTATAVTGNLTVTGQTEAGFLFIGPTSVASPTSSTLNFPSGDDRANAVDVEVGAGGLLNVTYVASSAAATAEAIFDVTGYFAPAT